MKFLLSKFNYNIFMLIVLVVLSFQHQIYCQTNRISYSSSVFLEDITYKNQKQDVPHLYRRSLTGNIIGTVLGGLTGAGFTRITGFANNTVVDGDPRDLDKILLGFYIGAVMGSGLGSAISLKSENTREFGKILLRTFIPHLIVSGAGLILVSATESINGLILGSAFLIAWLWTPEQAVRAYKDYNSITPHSQIRNIRAGMFDAHDSPYGIILFSVRIEL